MADDEPVDDGWSELNFVSTEVEAFVVDASAIVDLILGMGPHERLLNRLFIFRPRWHAPHLIDAEVLHAVRGHYLRQTITAERAWEALLMYRSLEIIRHSHHLLITRMWELRDNVSGYDAAYVALAELVRGTLITRDARLAATRGHTARIDYIG